MRFVIFITIITAVLTLASIYIGHRFFLRSPFFEVHRTALWIGLSLFLVTELVSPVLLRKFPEYPQVTSPLNWISSTALGVFATLFFYTAFVEVIVFIWNVFNIPDPVDMERRAFFTIGLLTAGSSVLGLRQALSGPQVTEVDIPIAGLPAAFHGFKIVQISDLHVGPSIRRAYVENVVKIVNSLTPDLLALTGDFADGEVDQLRDEIAPLQNMTAAHGKYFVPGNHESYWDYTAWLEEHRRLGSRVLLNEHVVIEKDGSSFVLAGVEDHSMDPDPKKALLGSPATPFKVLLAHQPATYKLANEHKFDLQLSGHTHAGQFFPWSVAVKLAQKYYKGLNRHEDMWVYVNRGTGWWGPPHRFAVPAEITLIKLVPA